jgi:hypothetical protein
MGGMIDEAEEVIILPGIISKLLFANFKEQSSSIKPLSKYSGLCWYSGVPECGSKVHIARPIELDDSVRTKILQIFCLVSYHSS